MTVLISNLVEGLETLYGGVLLILAKDDELLPVAPALEPLRENWMKAFQKMEQSDVAPWWALHKHAYTICTRSRVLARV